MVRSTGQEVSDAHGKALALNLDTSIYGTLAEIGAGQEVARWFLRVGAASGTVAKTISAYDKVVSDDIYGAGTRYVSKERLLAMLDFEYGLVLKRLTPTRGENTRFFVFADTVAARNYAGTNDQHGWLGIRFQHEPRAPESQLLLHINLHDSTAELQQQAIGVLGVNLIYATFHQRSDMESFLRGLFENLSRERIEADVIEFAGPAFTAQEARGWCLGLLRHNMSHAIVFDSSGRVVEPSSVLRKRPVVVIRGTFSHPELLDPGLFLSGKQRLAAEEGTPSEREPAAIAELSIRHVSRLETLSDDAMLECIRELTTERPVMVTNFAETYLLSRYFRRHTTEAVRFVVSVAAAVQIMRERFYEDLPGSLLEGLGRLLATNVKLYVAPMPREAFESALGNGARRFTVNDSSSMVGIEDIVAEPPGCHLLSYLRSSGRLVPL